MWAGGGYTGQRVRPIFLPALSNPSSLRKTLLGCQLHGAGALDESEMDVHQVSLAQAVGWIADPPYSFRSGGVGCVTSVWFDPSQGGLFSVEACQPRCIIFIRPVYR